MSPSESELRAALHEGEGEPLDAGGLIAHAQGVARHRQRRIRTAFSAAAGVVVVGGVVTLVSLAAGGGTHTEADGSAARPESAGAAAAAGSIPTTFHSGRAPAGGGAGSREVPASVSTGRSTQPEACGSALSGPALSHRSGASTALFPRPVASIRVCAPAHSPQPAASALLSGPAAAQLAGTLESGHAPAPAQCPEPSAVRPLVLHAVDAGGHASAPVELDLSCSTVTASNGSAVRYVPVTNLPAPVRRLLG